MEETIKIKPKKGGNPKWIKGMPSPNPTGRPEIAKEIRELAREKSKDALNVIINIMSNEAELAGVRLAAAKEVLKQAGCGVLNGEQPTPEKVALSTEQLLTILNKRE